MLDTPVLRPAKVEVDISVFGNGHKSNFSGDGVIFRYDADILLVDVSPLSVPLNYPSSLRIFGSGFVPSDELKCRIGTNVYDAVYVSTRETVCVYDGTLPLGRHLIEVSCNNQDYVAHEELLTIHREPILDGILPLSGPRKFTGSEIIVQGKYFRNTSAAVCRFGTVSVPAHFTSSSLIKCSAPVIPPDGLAWTALNQHRHVGKREGELLFPKAHNYPAYLSQLASFEISFNAIHFTASGMQYLYQDDADVYSVTPNTGIGSVHIPLFISGTGFVNSTKLRCRVGNVVIKPKYLSSSLLLCFAPPRAAILPNTGWLRYRKVRRENFMHAPSFEHSVDARHVFVEVANNGVDFTSSRVSFKYLDPCPGGSYCLEHEGRKSYLCPPGSYCHGTGNKNFTMCPRGTYQPYPGMVDCRRCPIGYICPDMGMRVPRICPAGFVCSVTGLEFATMPCPEGHFCLEGTSTSALTCGSLSLSSGLTPTSSLAELSHTLRPGRKPQGLELFLGSRNTACWSNSTTDMGMQMSSFPARFWMEKHMLPLSPTTPFEPTRGRYCLDDSCALLADASDLSATDYMFDYTSSAFALRRPIPCPKGHYCGFGTAANASNMKNFSTPATLLGEHILSRGKFIFSGRR